MDATTNARRTEVPELFGYKVVRFFDRRDRNLSPSHRLRRRAPPSL
jgi:hypothetical protein